MTGGAAARGARTPPPVRYLPRTTSLPRRRAACATTAAASRPIDIHSARADPPGPTKRRGGREPVPSHDGGLARDPPVHPYCSPALAGDDGDVVDGVGL